MKEEKAADARGSVDGEYRSDCPCLKKKCRNRGRCDDCKAKHVAKGQKPFCER